MAEDAAHCHYYYTFGTVVSKRTKELISKQDARSCQTEGDMTLVGNGENFCCFVAKARTTYPASSPSMYLTPKVKPASNAKSIVPEDKVQNIVTEEEM